MAFMPRLLKKDSRVHHNIGSHISYYNGFKGPCIYASFEAARMTMTRIVHDDKHCWPQYILYDSNNLVPFVCFLLWTVFGRATYT